MSSTSLNSKVPKYTAGTSGGTNSNSNSRYPQSSSSVNTPVNSGGGGGASSALPAEKFVTDAHFSNSKQLLNAYVYDFLIKSSLPETAQSFIKEADVPTGHPTTKTIKRPPQKDLLPLAISLDAPQGFLYEWWQIFWDVFNARTHRGGSENAQHYYQLQLARQQREIALHNSTLQAAHHQQLQLQQMNQQQQQQQLQYQQQLSQTIGMPQLNSTGQVAGQLPNGSFSSQISCPPGGTTPVPMAGNMQQFIMSQQWLQQQQKQLAATMSNGGRMMMGNVPPPPQQQQQQLKRGNDIEKINANRTAQAQVQYQMNQMRQQQMQQLQQQNGARAPVNLSASPAKKQKLEDKSTKEISEDKDGEKDGSASGSSALQDYQLQLMLLERENKKMLTNKSKETSTSNGNTPNTVTSTSATKRSKKDGNSSPLLNNKMPPPKGKGASPALSAGSNANIVSPGSIAESKKKKEPVRRGRGKKKDTALSNPPTPTTPLTPSQIVNSSTNASKREPTTSTIMEEHGEDLLGSADPSHFNHHQQRLNQHTINPTDLSPGSSQLTPPTSDSHKSTNGGNKQESTLSHLKMNDDDDFSAAASAAATENFGSQMLSSGNDHVDSDNDEDAFGGFGALGDFQNDLNNDNFNLENFLNQGHDAGDDDVGLGGDVGVGFESYWRDSVSN